MEFNSFRRVVTTFADEDNEVIVDEGKLLLFIRGKLVEAGIKSDPSEGVIVIHENEEYPARLWILSFLAKLSILADRIISYICPPEIYVSPKLSVDRHDQFKEDLSSSDSINKLREVLAEHPAGMTSIYFLTSDAGEGKTSLIEKISVEQARSFKKKETSSLILPVSLGGRSFLRFDDVVIASLMNRLRFPYLYYDSFLELIKMGAIIPAFDGFEEVLVDINSNEAVSAVGHLADRLSSYGTLLIATRSAYFDKSLNSQAKLLDSIGRGQNVQIQRFILNRWDREVFLNYAGKRDVRQPNKLYEQVKNRLEKETHPLLTRAVLVRRLIDVAKEQDDLDELLKRLELSEVNYFFDFIETIVKREVNEKWINRSGTNNSPLLTLDEHHQLLSLLAMEMWIAGVDALRVTDIEFLVEIFAQENDKSKDVQLQILRRIQDHALLREDTSHGSNQSRTRTRFDHEDFQEFYVGHALARSLCIPRSPDTRILLDSRALTRSIIMETVRYLRCHDENKKILDRLQDLSRDEQKASYIRENCGALMLELMHDETTPQEITDVSFPANALRQRNLRGLQISNSFFNSTSIDRSRIRNCTFHDCQFAELIIEGEYKLDGTIFDQCTFHSVDITNSSEDEHRRFFDPAQIPSVLKDKGFTLNPEPHQNELLEEENNPLMMDEDMKTALKFMRMFDRSTTIHKTLIRKRFRSKSSNLMKQILPELENAQLVEATDNSGDKYRLKVQLSEIDKLVSQSGDTFEQFIRNASL